MRYSNATKTIMMLILLVVFLVLVNPKAMDTLSLYIFKSFELVLRQMDKFCVNYQLSRGVWKSDATNASKPEPGATAAQ